MPMSQHQSGTVVSFSQFLNTHTPDRKFLRPIDGSGGVGNRRRKQSRSEKSTANTSSLLNGRDEHTFTHTHTKAPSQMRRAKENDRANKLSLFPEERDWFNGPFWRNWFVSPRKLVPTGNVYHAHFAPICSPSAQRSVHAIWWIGHRKKKKKAQTITNVKRRRGPELADS